MRISSRKIASCTGHSPRVPRGIRNNNPLNIRRGVQWRGLRDFATDKAFCEFKSMDYGFRAAFCILRTYFSKRGVRTLRQLISRWAPPTENNTEAYIRKVRLQAGLRDADSPLPPPWNPMAMGLWKDIVLAMAAVENGCDMQDYRSSCIKGWKKAFN